MSINCPALKFQSAGLEKQNDMVLSAAKNRFTSLDVKTGQVAVVIFRVNIKSKASVCYRIRVGKIIVQSDKQRRNLSDYFFFGNFGVI